jgi:hypothetical protein
MTSDYRFSENTELRYSFLYNVKEQNGINTEEKYFDLSRVPAHDYVVLSQITDNLVLYLLRTNVYAVVHITLLQSCFQILLSFQRHVSKGRRQRCEWDEGKKKKNEEDIKNPD